MKKIIIFVLILAPLFAGAQAIEVPYSRECIDSVVMKSDTLFVYHTYWEQCYVTLSSNPPQIEHPNGHKNHWRDVYVAICELDSYAGSKPYAPTIKYLRREQLLGIAVRIGPVMQLNEIQLITTKPN